MVRRGYPGLMDSADVRLYRWVDPKIVGMISYCNIVDIVEEAHAEVGPSPN